MSTLIDRIRLRCVECGDCLIWQGRVSAAGMPIITHKHSTLSARKALYEALHGKVPAGRLVTPICGHKRCMAEDHIQALTARASKRLSAQRGAFSNPARARKAALTMRSRSRYSDAIIALVRQAATPQEASRLTGVNLAYAYEIRKGTARREYAANPFDGLGSRT